MDPHLDPLSFNRPVLHISHMWMCVERTMQETSEKQQQQLKCVYYYNLEYNYCALL